MKSCEIIIVALSLFTPSFTLSQSGWTVIPSGTPHRLNGIVTSFNNPSVSTAYGDSGVIVRSEDYGLSWTLLQPGSSGDVFHSMTFAYDDTALIAGYDGAAGLVKKMYFDASGLPVIINLSSPSPKSINDITFRTL